MRKPIFCALAAAVFVVAGNTVAGSSDLAGPNTYRLAMYHYGYRFYDPSVQRWINRDPYREPGFEVVRRSRGGQTIAGPNLNIFLRNNAINRVDPSGLKIWVCTVRTSGFPLYGIGTHAYFWDDRAGKECGQEGSSGSGGNTSGNTGPKAGDPGNPWHGKGGKGDPECYPVAGSAGKEDAVMSCCKKNANSGIWFPGINDCHTKVDDCLEKNGLTSPPHPGGTPPVEMPPDWPPSQ